MLEELMTKYIPVLVSIFELMGVIVITIGAFTAFYFYLRQVIFKKQIGFKHQFATAMATGLEFKLAAEILKTVLVKTLDELVILGAVFLLRVLMTFVIQWEIKQGNSENAVKKNIKE
ncbi:MAG: DUF1622 domain-containing protein [Paraclostridium sp.]|uniref:DUF1622 domain-containing protein n=1 Tax=Paraclostridium sp. TaxID=2023273 RepID=UPI003F3ABA89